MPRYLFTLLTLLGNTYFLLSSPAMAQDFPKEGETGWVMLSGFDLSEWREPRGDWFISHEVKVDPQDEKKLWTPGKEEVNQLLFNTKNGGVMVNGLVGKTEDLHSAQEFGDVELHVEFMVPKDSNSGIYLQARYEIQIMDSWGVEHPKYSDCGGIYQRFNNDPNIPAAQQGYEGKAPRVNASKTPGEWQTFDITFQAPRFDEAGKKTQNAKFIKVILNGQVIHENEEVTGPTRSGTYQDEKPLGPLMIQGDHGPVALRNVLVRPAKD